jgi:hypothetical protein
MVVAAGVGAELIMFGLDVLDFWPLAFHGPFWFWTALTLVLAASTRFAAWLLLFGWVVMWVWAFLVALTTGFDILLIPPALVFLIVPAVAFLTQEPLANDLDDHPLTGAG